MDIIIAWSCNYEWLRADGQRLRAARMSRDCALIHAWQRLRAAMMSHDCALLSIGPAPGRCADLVISLRSIFTYPLIGPV